MNRITGSNGYRYWPLCEALSGLLDHWVHPSFWIRDRRYPAFRVCGYVGLSSAVIMGFGVTWYRGLPLWVLLVLLISSVATFLALAMATKIIVGEEWLIYYHHEIAILLIAGGVLWLLGQPVLAFLEITLLGVGSFLLCGRIGCFLVGCCHGCPHSFGVRYRQEHADEGFPQTLVGVRLLPVQLVESAAVTFTVAGGLILVLWDAQPGEVLAWYSIVYGLVRFTLEFFRGDAARPYFGSFSEAQWTTLVLMGLTGLAELTGVLPLRIWHVAVTAGLVIFMFLWATTDGLTRRIFRPKHVQQVAELLKAADSRSRASGELHIGQTDLGIHLSVSTVAGAATDSNIVAFSTPNRPLGSSTAKKFARLLSWLKGSDAELIEGRSGVYYVVFCDDGGKHAV